MPQYLHLVAATGRSSERQAGQVLTGAGSPNTVAPVATGVHTPGANPAGRVWRLAGDPRPGRRRLAELPSRHGGPDIVYNPHYDSLGLAE